MNPELTKPVNRAKRILINVILIVMVLGLMLAPLFMAKNAEFGGADIRAKEALSEIKPGFKPWFNPIFAPQSGEVETFFFALQSALGAGLIGYFLGYMQGRAKKDAGK
ncbi:MAG: energy-coupling factor ABC transporter substrate-binding protein [Bacillota bacterium]